MHAYAVHVACNVCMLQAAYACMLQAAYACMLQAAYACKLRMHVASYSLGERDIQKREREKERDARKRHNKRLWREGGRGRESLLRDRRT